MEPQTTITNITPELIKLWDKELERLHDTLTKVETKPEDREWTKKRIEALHALVFANVQLPAAS